MRKAITQFSFDRTQGIYSHAFDASEIFTSLQNLMSLKLNDKETNLFDEFHCAKHHSFFIVPLGMERAFFP